MNLVEIGTRVLTSCMDVKAGETVLVVTDDEKFQIGQTLYQAAKELGADAMLVTMSPREVSGQEPPGFHRRCNESRRCGFVPDEHLHHPHPRQDRSSKSRGADRYHAQHHRGYVPSGCYDRRL